MWSIPSTANILLVKILSAIQFFYSTNGVCSMSINTNEFFCIISFILLFWFQIKYRSSFMSILISSHTLHFSHQLNIFFFFSKHLLHTKSILATSSCTEYTIKQQILFYSCNQFFKLREDGMGVESICGLLLHLQNK